MIYIYSHGRMGNQYFEYACARSFKEQIQKKYGIKHDIVIKIGKEGDMLKHTNAKYITSNGEKFPKKILLRINNIIAGVFFKNDDKNHKYGKFINKILNIFGVYYNRVGYYNFKIYKRKNYILDGYFQSEKYFCNYNRMIVEELKNKKSNLLHIDNSVCIHIRRGDYLSKENSNKFLICNKEYYEDAIKYFKEKKNIRFYVFSDDIEWVKENYFFPKDTFFEDTKKDFYDNFNIMYNCSNFILSNSSYSWWAQYLADTNIVIAPKTWNRETNNRDIYQDKWILIGEK